jgi:hypothetical protein
MTLRSVADVLPTLACTVVGPQHQALSTTEATSAGRQSRARIRVTLGAVSMILAAFRSAMLRT